MLDVVVIGGDSSALIAGLALKRVLPATKVFRPVKGGGGGMISLQPSTAKALHAISPDLCQTLRDSLDAPHPRMRVLTTEGERLTGENEDYTGYSEWLEKTYGYGTRIGMGDRLFKVALEIAEREGVVEVGDFDGLETSHTGGDLAAAIGAASDSQAGRGEGHPGPPSLTARIKGADGETKAVACHLLIGADGAASRVRSSLLDPLGPLCPGNAHPYVSTGAAAWTGVCTLGQVEAALGEPAEIVIQGGPNGTGLIFRGRGTDPSSPIVWFGSLPYDTAAQRLGEAPAPFAIGAAARASLHKALSGWPEPFLNAVAATPDQMIFQLGPGKLRSFPGGEPRQWGLGRVGLLGDAFHACGPYSFSQATEDAHQLALSVQALGATPAALRDYEAKRAARVALVCNTMVKMYEEELSAADRVDKLRRRLAGRATGEVGPEVPFSMPEAEIWLNDILYSTEFQPLEV